MEHRSLWIACCFRSSILCPGLYRINPTSIRFHLWCVAERQSLPFPRPPIKSRVCSDNFTNRGTPLGVADRISAIGQSPSSTRGSICYEHTGARSGSQPPFSAEDLRFTGRYGPSVYETGVPHVQSHTTDMCEMSGSLSSPRARVCPTTQGGPIRNAWALRRFLVQREFGSIDTIGDFLQETYP